MAFEIITNNAPRHIVYGYELTNKEREEFDYYSEEELMSASFFRYKGQVYDIGEFMRITDTMRLHNDFKDWQGYSSDSYFSGVVVKYASDYESVIVGTYIS